MFTIDFSRRGKRGLCDFLYESVKNAITAGTLCADEKLPSKRSLADHLGVSVITVQNAYELLAVEGYIYSVEKKGYFVTDIKNNVIVQKGDSDDIKNHDDEKASPTEQNFFADFSSNATGFEKFPFSLWSKTMRNVLNGATEKLLQKTDAKGVYELRLAIARHLHDFRNMNVSPQNIVIGAGSESLYTTLIQLLGKENCFAVENPGYKKIANVFEVNAARWQPVGLDDEGMSTGLLRKSGANVAHVSPSHHFPTGVVMSVRRRNELLLWANEAAGRFIIEDDYDSEFRFNGKPLATLQSADKNGKVIYINTFTKTLAPSFRISYMVLPDKLSARFESVFGGFSSPVSAFEQFTLAHFILNGDFARHIIRMKNYYRSLRNEIITAFSSKEFSGKVRIDEEDSGLHFLLTVCDDTLPLEKVRERLIEKKIRLPVLSDFYYGTVPPESEKIFVINYSGIQKKEIPTIAQLVWECIM